ncbi:MAG: YceI family protein [Acidobacteriota bacterium]
MRSPPNLTLAVLAVAVLCAASPVRAATFHVDPGHSSVGFTIRHLVGKIAGQFDNFSGTIQLDPDRPRSATVEFTIQTASINTRNEKRDSHLKSEEFFDVETYPTITFRSDKVTGEGPIYQVHGTLDMHGSRQPVVLKVELLGVAPDPWGNLRAGFEATAALDRKDFGIQWNRALEGGGLILGDEVGITIILEAIAEKKAAAESSATRTK